MAVVWIIRWRNQDGSWSVNTDEIYTKRDAEKECQKMRCLFGVIGQPWKLAEWEQLEAKRGKA